ncbi:MAG: hypothetical protein IIA67_12225 [Planctomycetes bacterium]|nr:hypothetical protein [Planctomycetota bacterium]
MPPRIPAASWLGGLILAVLSTLGAGPTALALDGTVLALRANKFTRGDVILIDAATAAITSLHSGACFGPCFSPDGKQMASTGDGSHLRLWSIEDGNQLSEIDTPGPKMLSLEFLDKQRLAAGGSDNVVHLWDTASGRKLARLEGHTGSVASMDYNPSTGLLVTGSYDTTIRLWKLDKLDEKLSGRRQATRPGRPQTNPK